MAITKKQRNIYSRNKRIIERRETKNFSCVFISRKKYEEENILSG